MQRAPKHRAAIDDLEVVATSFMRHLRAENLSPNTIESYGTAVQKFAAHLHQNGMPSTLSGIRREHIESWVEHLLATRAPATANNRYRGLQAFWRWATAEGEVQRSPMARMRPPRIPEKAVPILSLEDLDRLLKACRGATFETRRDMALLQMFLSTGARKSEIGNLHLDDVDLDTGRALVRGKGGRDRLVDLTPRTVRALDRYLRMRPGHFAAGLPWVWLGKRGRLTPDGCGRALTARAEQAGLPHLHAHLLRHAFAHYFLADGGGEDALMRHLGWRSREMVSRYAASAGQERALSLNRRFGLGARF